MARLAWLEDLSIENWLLPGGCIDLDRCPDCWERNAHLERYGFACAALAPLRNASVLDFGCGIGYGSEMLAAAGNIVVGCDSSVEALTIARLRRGNLATFVLPNELPLRVHATVAFEVLEHLEDPEAFLADIQARSGHLIVSTPIVPTKANNPWHKHDFTWVEFRKMVAARFAIQCEWFQMRPWHVEPCYAVIYGVSR